MIVTDALAQAVQGTQAEVFAVVKEAAAHFERLWPQSVPRQALVDINGEVGRIHLINEALAEHERQPVEQRGRPDPPGARATAGRARAPWRQGAGVAAHDLMRGRRSAAPAVPGLARRG
jgi:hypothetical protein